MIILYIIIYYIYIMFIIFYYIMLYGIILCYFLNILLYIYIYYRGTSSIILITGCCFRFSSAMLGCRRVLEIIPRNGHVWDLDGLSQML